MINNARTKPLQMHALIYRQSFEIPTQTNRQYQSRRHSFLYAYTIWERKFKPFHLAVVPRRGRAIYDNRRTDAGKLSPIALCRYTKPSQTRQTHSPRAVSSSPTLSTVTNSNHCQRCARSSFGHVHNPRAPSISFRRLSKPMMRQEHRASCSINMHFSLDGV